MNSSQPTEDDSGRRKHTDQMMLRVTLIGVLISLAAAGAAFWASSEAHKSRQEAGELGRRSLDLQSHSIDAQIRALQADERPYLRVEVGNGTQMLTFHDAGSQPGREAGHFVRVPIPRLSAATFGRTPALEVQNFEDCTFFTDDGDYHLPPPPQGYTVMGTIFQGEKPNLDCFALGRMPAGAHVTKGSIVRLEGFIAYKSLLGGSYRTPFCYEHYLFPKSEIVKSCTAESPS
jgi:hypothetical protein